MSLGESRARWIAMTAAACFLMLVAAAGSRARAAAQASAPPAQTGADAPLISDAVFKNVQVLKGIPVDEFMDTMGMFASSLGFDCVSCHSGDIYTDRGAFAQTTPLIQRARQMIVEGIDVERKLVRVGVIIPSR